MKISKLPIIFSTILFLLILILSVVISVDLKHTKQSLKQSYTQNNELAKSLSTSLKKNTILLTLNYQKLNNINIQSLDGKYVSLKDEIKFPVFIFRFDSRLTCNTCFNNTIKVLNLLGDKIGNDKIILISKYNTINELKFLKINNPFNLRSYNYSGNWIEIFEKSQIDGMQVTFILENNFRVLLPYFPSMSDSISNNYYSKIIDFFKESERFSNIRY